MDKRLREEIAAWLEFYRELGIEDFYRRPSGPVHREEGGPVSQHGSLEVGATAQVAPTYQSAPSEMFGSAEEVKATQRAMGALGGRAAARSLSLFEVPAQVRAHETLDQIREDLGDCHRCRLAAGRKTIVFGQGNPNARLVFVGEAPGADEDEQGLPFVGRAGQFLNRMIQLIGMKREEVYICNVIKCRPPGNRTPQQDEIETCSPFLFRQIEAIQPRLVCCLGAPAVRTILGIKEGITKIRGRFFEYGPAKVLVTFHPAYILRNPREEKILHEDFEKIRHFLKEK